MWRFLTKSLSGTSLSRNVLFVNQWMREHDGLKAERLARRGRNRRKRYGVM
jgi:hypothetical protein